MADKSNCGCGQKKSGGAKNADKSYKKQIKHDPQAESARAVFGKKQGTQGENT